MTLQPRHLVLATLLHVVLFSFLFAGVQCSQHVETTQVMQGVLINPNDLKSLRPPTPPGPPPQKPQDEDQGPQQIVKDTDVVADQAKQKQEQAAAEAAQKQLDEQKAAAQAAEQKAAEQKATDQKAAEQKAEELKQQQEAQKQAAEQAAAVKKQQDEAKRAADAAASAAAAEAQRKKELDEQLRKEAQEKQDAQAAAMAKQKKAEEAQREAERRQRVAELNAQLGAASADLTAKMQGEWAAQLTDAITRAWARPPGTDQNLKAYLAITLAPTGEVLSASIGTSSGVPAYDDSLTRAVYRASPLPKPSDPGAFVPNVNICFSPNPRNCQQ